jgi:hypothetical protein
LITPFPSQVGHFLAIGILRSGCRSQVPGTWHPVTGTESTPRAGYRAPRTEPETRTSGLQDANYRGEKMGEPSLEPHPAALLSYTRSHRTDSGRTSASPGRPPPCVIIIPSHVPDVKQDEECLFQNGRVRWKREVLLGKKRGFQPRYPGLPFRYRDSVRVPGLRSRVPGTR